MAIANLPGWVRGDSRMVTPGKNALTADEVRAIIDYNPTTGEFRWKVKRYKSASKPGDPCGCITRPRGEHIISIGSPPGNQYKAHRIAWLIMTGEWPSEQIDHKDGDPSNNRWANLRPSSHIENQQNRPKLSNNTSGYKGVSLHRPSGKYFAMIRYDGQQHFLGAFDSAAEAGSAYQRAAAAFHGKFSRTKPVDPLFRST